MAWLTNSTVRGYRLLSVGSYIVALAEENQKFEALAKKILTKPAQGIQLRQIHVLRRLKGNLMHMRTAKVQTTMARLV